MKIIVPGLIFGFLAALVLYGITTLDAGYVRITWGHWLIETNLILFSLLVLIVVTLGFGLLVLTRHFLRTSSVLRSFFSGQRHQRRRNRSSRGMLAYLEGNWPRAKKLLSQSAEHADVPLVNYLAAAHAANELGDTQEAEKLLQQAYACSQSSDLAVGITQARLQLDAGKLEQSLALLSRLKKAQPNHPSVLKLLSSVLLRLENWQELTQLIPALRLLPKSDVQKLDDLEARAWAQMFYRKTETLKHSGLSRQPAASEALANLWRQVPETLRFNAQIIAAYARQLLAQGFESECETLLRKTLNKDWDDGLVSLYGQIKGQNVAEQLQNAESWLKRQPDNAELLLALGRLSLRNALWRKAQDYFESSYRRHPTLTCFAELSRLNSHLHTDPRSLKLASEGMYKALKLPELPLPETHHIS